MVSLESAAMGVLAITTFQAGLADWEHEGMLVEPKVGALADSLIKASR